MSALTEASRRVNEWAEVTADERGIVAWLEANGVDLEEWDAWVTKSALRVAMTGLNRRVPLPSNTLAIVLAMTGLSIGFQMGYLTASYEEDE